jgi:protein gp37
VAEKTAISWTTHTFNPWWGCWKIADECKICYAQVFANRLGFDIWERTGPRRFFKPHHWEQLRKWNAKAAARGVREQVFVGSMCDWAERHPVALIAAEMDLARTMTWQLVRECTSLDFLFLTKRGEDAAELVPWANSGEPYPNVWMGGTAGTRKMLRDNILPIREIRAAVHFISGEPLLEDIPASDWNEALRGGEGLAPIDWLIIGDESGHGARPAKVDWVRTARDAAERNGVAFHFKQWCGKDGDGIEGRGKPRQKIHLPILDGRRHAEMPEVPRG